MDLRQLRYFVRAVELKSITRAADELNISQPALGLHIRRLEDELNTELLIRHSRGIELSEAGTIFLEHARSLIDGMEQAKRALHDIQQTPQGTVHVGVPPSVNLILSEMLVKTSRSELPQVRLSIVEDFTTVLVEAIAADRLDLACVYRSEMRGLVFEPLLRQNLCFITAPGATEDDAKPITLAEIVRYPLVLSGTKHGFRQRMEAAFRAADLSFNLAYEVQSESLAKELVQQGNNGTILPLSAVRMNVQEGKLVARPIDPAISVDLYLTYKEQRTLSPSQKAVRNLIRRIAHDQADLDDTLWTYSGD